MSGEPAPPRPAAMLEIAGSFLRLGFLAFGGPVAHIAMMQDEFVDRRRWINRVDFTDALAATNLLPGPNSTEMAIHLGYRRAGVPGALVAGSAFILPAAAMVLALAWAYFRWGTLPTVEHLFAGIQPAVVVLIAFAAWRLRAAALRGPSAAALAIAAFSLSLLAPRWEVLFLLLAGLAMIAVRGLAGRMAAVCAPGVLAGATVLPALLTVGGVSLVGMAFTFLKVGGLLFGGGFVMIPLLQPEAVGSGWLTDGEFLDGLAIGQATPGPIVTTATFVGYAAAGWAGAAVATVAVFAPAFFFATTLGYSMRRLGSVPGVRAFLDGVSAAVFGAIAGAAVALGGELPLDALTVVVIAASVVVLGRGLAPAYGLIGASGALGLVAGWAGLI